MITPEDAADILRKRLNEFTRERTSMLRVVTETKAELQAERGRVIGFVKSSEPGKISVAVPADRAVMTPTQARAFAAWLVEEANKGDKATTADARTDAGWRQREAERQAAIRASLDSDRVMFRGRTYVRRDT